MKKLLEFIKDLCNFFKPKARKESLMADQERTLNRYYDNLYPTQGYVVKAGEPASISAVNLLHEAGDPSTTYATMAQSLGEPFQTPLNTKKKKQTKKQTAEANATAIIELLKWVSDSGISATQLQTASKIRRDRFLPLLKKLVKNGKIARTGTGKRGDPYRYTSGKGKV